MDRFIHASSIPEVIVFDPSMGSGSVGIAAKRTRRNFIGVELNEKYYKITQERINKAIKGIGEKKDITSFL